MAKNKKASAIDVLELDYRLAELPSSQHRAGLAGLVLMVQWLKRQGSHPGVCDIAQLSTHGATLRIDQAGLAVLFDEVYAASQEEREEKRPRKNKRKGVIPPLREEIRTDVDPKTGQEKTRTVYVYPQIVPGGAFLADGDPSASGSHGLWIKLWRDVMWTIFRGRANQRLPFTDRAAGKQGKDAAKVWSDLIQPPDYPVKLPGTYFIGAEACNAENVPFRDRARFQFLLHFWPYVAQVYVPAIYDNEGEQSFVRLRPGNSRRRRPGRVLRRIAGRLARTRRRAVPIPSQRQCRGCRRGECARPSAAFACTACPANGRASDERSGARG